MAARSASVRREMSLARRRCARVLSRFHVAPVAVGPDHVISVCIPVYDESLDRLREQIRAFARQRFPKDQFELVYIVNNDRPKSTPPRVLRANRRAIRFLRAAHPVTIRVIDCSSPGREIAGCTIGVVRNVGLHAIAAGYLAHDREGIIIFSDADTVPTSTTYLARIWKDMRRPKAVGAAGGLEFVLDLDTVDRRERAFFRKHIGTLRAYSRWLHLTDALYKNDLTPPEPTRFSGAHMITKAAAGVCAGGFPDAARAEDVVFGVRLEAYADRTGRRVLPRRDVWFMRTAIRESTRTRMSFGPIFANIKKNGSHPLVRNPLGREHPAVPLTTRRLRALEAVVFRDPRRKAYVLNATKSFSNYKLAPQRRAG